MAIDERNPKELSALVVRAKQLGAADVEVLHVAEERRTFTHRGRTPTQSNVTTSRVWLTTWLPDGGAGTWAGHPDDAALGISKAIRDAEAHHRSVARPEPRVEPGQRALDIDDRRYPNVQLTDIQEMFDENVAAAQRACPAAEFVGAAVHASREVVTFASSVSPPAQYGATTFAASMTVDAPFGQTVERLSEEVTSRSFATIACLPWGHNLGSRVASLQDESPVQPGPVRVAFPPRLVANALDWIARCAALEAMKPGSTWFRTGRTLHRRLHLTDDRAVRGGLRTVPFDVRGVLPRPVLLLREGEPFEGYTPIGAASPTGHAWKTTPLADDELPIRPGNLLMNGGLRSLQALRAEMKRLIFHVEQVDISGADPLTGELDARAWGSLWDGSRRVGAWIGVRLQGSLLDCLSQVAAVSSETDRVGHVDAPALVVDGLRVA